MAESANVKSELVDFIETDVDINSSADYVYDVFRSKCYLFHRLMPDEITKVELLVPEWNTVKSKRRWTFAEASKCGIWKDVVTAIDDRMKSVTWTLVDGEVPKKLYCSLEVKFDFSQQCGPKAHLKLTYEKQDADVPVPHNYLDFLVHMVKKVDENPLTSNEKYA